MLKTLNAIASTFSTIFEKVRSLRVGVGVGVAVGVGVGVAVGVGVGVAVGVGVGVGSTGFTSTLGAALTVTPLFHTSFVPDLTQENFLPAAVAVIPALVHLAPALGVAA